MGCARAAREQNLFRRLADPKRFERSASAFGGQRSIQLSYGSSFCVIAHPRPKSQGHRSLPAGTILVSRAAHRVPCPMTSTITAGFISDTNDRLRPEALNASAGSELITNVNDPERATPPGARDHHWRAHRHRRLGSVATGHYVLQVGGSTLNYISHNPGTRDLDPKAALFGATVSKAGLAPGIIPIELRPR